MIIRLIKSVYILPQNHLQLQIKLKQDDSCTRSKKCTADNCLLGAKLTKKQISSLYCNFIIHYSVTMGCQTSSAKETVPISNSILHLMHAGQTDQIIHRIQAESEAYDINAILNFKGDTLIHYACIKNNRKLVEFLVSKGADASLENKENKKPVDLTTDEEIKMILSMITMGEKAREKETNKATEKETNKATDSAMNMHYPVKETIKFSSDHVLRSTEDSFLNDTPTESHLQKSRVECRNMHRKLLRSRRKISEAIINQQ